MSIVPVRAATNQSSEQRSQLLYGEPFKITEHRKEWYKIRVTFDGTEGWVQKNQVCPIDKATYQSVKEIKHPAYAADLVSYVSRKNEQLIPIVLGSSVQYAPYLGHIFDGEEIRGKQDKATIVHTALQYLNAPYQWGGKSPFGVDCSGLTQMVYKVNGHALPRNASEQATKGEVLSFVEECEPGDLAFFDNEDGVITHVGIIMNNNYIIHAHGYVRIDRLDQTGIFNTDMGTYTHKLRVIKKML
jgi:cell wall-associated NlpC family hydrolase